MPSTPCNFASKLKHAIPELLTLRKESSDCALAEIESLSARGVHTLAVIWAVDTCFPEELSEPTPARRRRCLRLRDIHCRIYHSVYAYLDALMLSSMRKEHGSQTAEL